MLLMILLYLTLFGTYELGLSANTALACRQRKHAFEKCGTRIRKKRENHAKSSINPTRALVGLCPPWGIICIKQIQP